MDEKQFTILVVDDDACFRQLIVHILTPEYRVVEARTVNDAIAILGQQPDLAIIDFHLPGMDGASFIRNLREQGYTLPLVFCSGASIDHRTFSSMRNVCQVNLIVQKPIQPQMFKEQITALLPKPAGQPVDEYHQYITGEYDIVVEQNVIAETELAIQELAEIYLSEVPENLDQLRLEMIMAAAQKEIALLDLAANRAHQLKGTAGSLGFTQLGEYGRQLEKAVHALMSEELFEESETWQMAIDLIDSAAAWTKRELNHQNDSDGLELVDAMQPVTIVPAQLISPEQMIQPVQIMHAQSERLPIILPACDLLPITDFETDDLALETLLSKNNETPEVVMADLVMPERILPQRVLVIDADQAIRSELAMGLSDKYTVQTVSGAMESFAVMDEFQPDAVIIQLAMPGVNGLAISRMIRCNERWQNTIIIILTDNCAATTRHNIFEAGATDYVVSPVVPMELNVRIDTHLSHRAATFKGNRLQQTKSTKLLLDTNIN